MSLLPSRRLFVLVPVSLLAAAAYLQAVGVGHVVGFALVSPGLPVAVAHAAEPSGFAAAPTPHARSLSSYALFGEAPQAATPVSAARPAVALGDLYDAPACEGITLATLASMDDPKASLATLRLGSPARLATVRQGDAVSSGHLLFVGKDRVWIDGPAGTCQASLFPKAVVAAAPSTSGGAATKPPPVGLASRIRAVSEGEVEIDRAAVDELVERGGLLARAVRTTPVLGPDGALRGVMVKSIAETPDGAVATALGLRAGDILLSVNGYSVAKPEELLGAFARLRQAPRIALVVERNGAPTTLAATPR